MSEQSSMLDEILKQLEELDVASLRSDIASCRKELVGKLKTVDEKLGRLNRRIRMVEEDTASQSISPSFRPDYQTIYPTRQTIGSVGGGGAPSIRHMRPTGPYGRPR